MIIAIDETGSFRADSPGRSFFVAIHLRQRRTLYKQKEAAFARWEASLPKTLKNPKGEIKSTILSDQQLEDFVRRVICSHHHIGITPYCMRPINNQEVIIKKYQTVQGISMEEGAKEATELGNRAMANVYCEMANWLRNLNYIQYLKIYLLGACIADALVNTVGHAITGRYEEELLRMKYLIDKDFIKEPRHNTFWHEFLRNQLYYHSEKNPLPLLQTWREDHPFLKKYMRNGLMDFNELFWKNCAFVSSHKHFEIRIADAVNTVISRHFNKKKCNRAYSLLKAYFLGGGRIIEIVLEDFDLEKWRYKPEDNPWRKLSNNSIQKKDEKN